MEYTLTISQKAIADNFPTLDIKDAAIIDFLSRFSASKKIAKKIIGDSIFYWFDYNKIATENPLLKLGSEAIRKRLRELCSLGILEAHPLNSGGRVFFAFGDNFELTHKYEPRENDTDLLRKTSGRKSRPPREENPDLSAKPRENDTDISNIPLDQKNQDQNNQETTPKKKSKPLKEKKEKEKKRCSAGAGFFKFRQPRSGGRNLHPVAKIPEGHKTPVQIRRYHSNLTEKPAHLLRRARRLSGTDHRKKYRKRLPGLF